MRKSKRYTAADGFDATDMSKYAFHHMKAAALLFYRGGFWVLDSAGYLAHLSIELLLKSLILRQQGWFEKQHDLKKLAASAIHLGVLPALPPEVEEDLHIIGRYEAARYPVPQGPIQVGTLDRENMLRLWNWLMANCPADAKRALEKSDITTKGGRVLMTKPIGEAAT